MVVEPLRALLRKDSTFKWTDETEKAFCQLKELTITSPALALFDPMLPTVTMALVLYNSMATLKRQLLLHHVLLQTVKGNTAQSKRKLLPAFGQLSVGVLTCGVDILLFALITVL